jgi:hypothetical protein
LTVFALPYALRPHPGAVYFSGGVPAAWAPAHISGLPAAGAEEAGWRTPGPAYNANIPFVVVVKLGVSNRI